MTENTLYNTAISLEPELQHQGFDTVRRMVRGATIDVELIHSLATVLDKRKEMIHTLSNIVETLCKG